MGWATVLLCLFLWTVTRSQLLAAAPRSIADPNSPRMPILTALPAASSCEFNKTRYRYNDTRTVPEGVFVCTEQTAGLKNVWHIKSCTWRDKQVPYMKEVSFGNESMMCAVQRLPNNTFTFAIKRTWPSPLAKPAAPATTTATQAPTTIVTAKPTKKACAKKQSAQAPITIATEKMTKKPCPKKQAKPEPAITAKPTVVTQAPLMKAEIPAAVTLIAQDGEAS